MMTRIYNLMLVLLSQFSHCEPKKSVTKLEVHHPAVQVVRSPLVLLLCDQAPPRLLCDTPVSSDAKLQDAEETTPTVFSPSISIFFSLNEERHHHPVLQHEFDKRYGLTIIPE